MWVFLRLRIISISGYLEVDRFAIEYASGCGHRLDVCM